MPNYTKDSLTELGPATDADLANMTNTDLVDALICGCLCHEHTRYTLKNIYMEICLMEICLRLGNPMGRRQV